MWYVLCPAGIGANNGKQKGHFSTPEAYDEFYTVVCRLVRCPYEEVGTRMQGMVGEWLTSIGEEDAGKWFIDYWTGPGNGRWLLAHYGVGTVPFNNGLESLWRWLRDKICRNNVVSCVIRLEPRPMCGPFTRRIHMLAGRTGNISRRIVEGVARAKHRR